MKFLALIVSLLIGLLLPAPTAQADPIPQCIYPNTCFYFDVVPGIGNARGLVIDAPLESNGAHWHYEFGSGGVAANAGGNIAAPGFQGLNGGIPVGLSITLASATWRCPDQRYEAEAPTVIGTWNKDRPPPRRCVAVRVSPTAPLAPWPPTTDVNIKVSWPPEAPPQPVDSPVEVPPFGSTQEQGLIYSPMGNQDPLPNVRQGG